MMAWNKCTYRKVCKFASIYSGLESMNDFTNNLLNRKEN